MAADCWKDRSMYPARNRSVPASLDAGNLVHVRAKVSVPLAGAEHLRILRRCQTTFRALVCGEEEQLIPENRPTKRSAINVLMNRRLLTRQRK